MIASNSEITMLLANKEDAMTVFDTLNPITFNPIQHNNPIMVRRLKLKYIF